MERYITEESGVRTVVILSVEEDEALVQVSEDERIATESLAEMATLRDRTREKATRPLDEVEAEIEREERSHHG